MADDGYVLEYRNFDAGKNPFSSNLDAKTKLPKFMYDSTKTAGKKALALDDIRKMRPRWSTDRMRLRLMQRRLEGRGPASSVTGQPGRRRRFGRGQQAGQGCLEGRHVDARLGAPAQLDQC